MIAPGRERPMARSYTADSNEVKADPSPLLDPQPALACSRTGGLHYCENLRTAVISSSRCDDYSTN